LAGELVKHERYADDRDLPLLVWYGLIPVGDQDPRALLRLVSASRLPVTTRCLSRNLAERVESHPDLLDELLQVALRLDAPFQHAVLTGIEEAFRGWRKVERPGNWDQVVTSELARTEAELVRELSTLFGDGRALAEVRRTALDDKAEMKIRQAALETLIDARPDDLRGVCESLLGVRFLNGVAVRGLATFDDPAIAAQLVKNYRRFHPDDRLKVLATLVSRPSFAAELLDRMGTGSGQISPAEMTPFYARQIRSLGDERLNQKLAAVWGELRESSADRRRQIAQAREQLTTERLQAADLSAGRALFTKTCASCHMLYGSGNKIGPDLTGSQRSNLDYLLDNILDPSAVVGKEYRMSVVVLVHGRVLNGLVVSRNEKSLVLQTPTNQETIPVDEIESIRETTQSSMPDELLANLSPDQVRDLMAYLMHPSQVPMP
jgi:putative heme-binding domain-containing protein